ncbi:uncharacterized protein LOC126856152 [Cataglyphis hispanica]|uniref:uncharacterized protein LOC126856152 n=1 Tax=Cataglyphis hispanica TaxID=1086592 RepID=UPI00218011BB|nr:uncharacterized protein LOC126856152 [Cataglyphis hispanica]
MSINTLCAAFRKIAVGRISTIATARCYSTQQSNCDVNVISRLTSNSHGIDSTKTIDIKFIPGTLNIDFGIRTNGNLIRNIIEMPVTKIPPLQDPVKRLPIRYDLPISEKSIDLPTNGEIFEKHAVRLIVIRHKKMKKHKRRKLRKKMQFIWAKLRHKRNVKKEKVFQAELINKIKQAQAFDAKVYIKEKLNILNKERIPRTFRGEILPAEMIKKFIDEKKAKQEAKRNKPRLIL